GANFRIEAAAGVEVVIYPSRPRALDLVRLLSIHQADRQAQFQPRQLGADSIARLAQMLDIVRRRTAHAADHAVAACPALDRDSRALDQFGGALHLVNRDFGFRDERLRAVAAILGADAALRVAQHANLHPAAEGGLAHDTRRS